MALGERAVDSCFRDSSKTYSLFHGALGAALLMEDLKQPEQACFPLFEREIRSSAVVM